jgi:DNA-binding CsgD family transcriptional regulator
VGKHVSWLFEKLDVPNRTRLVQRVEQLAHRRQ